MITPAMSVLSAVEGLAVGSSTLEPLVLPVTLAILVGLFLAQKFGTARVGVIFGPITFVWFTVIGLLGLRELLAAPEIVFAAHPGHAVRFLVTHGTAGFILLGAVVLAVTGAEALYADMGHFGKRPIRLAWFLLVLPRSSSIISVRGRSSSVTRRRRRTPSSCWPRDRCSIRSRHSPPRPPSSPPRR